jgi:pSer/pThr/pTyr-binding forkhead associated (FHA) protein
VDRIIVQFLSGGRAGHTEVYPVTRFSSLYLGRDPKCDLRVDAERDAMVSRSHAVIEWVDDDQGQRQYTLTDLLSSNGTYLNGERIHGTVNLNSGDRVRLGVKGPEFVLTVERPEPNLQAVITQSMQADDLLRTPPPRNRPAPERLDGNATVTGGTLAGLVPTQDPAKALERQAK